MSLHEQFPAYGGRGPGDLRLGIALAVIATIFMALRVYVRLRINQFGTSALIWFLIAWFFTAITQIFGILSVLHGLGNHITVISKVDELHSFLLFTWVTVFFFNLAIPTGKVAVAVFLIEMNQQSNPRIRKSLIAVAAINIVLNIPQVVMVWFQCSPVDALWDPLRQSQCDNRKSVYYTYFIGTVAALSDFYLAVVPIHMLLPLRIDRKLKWGLSFLMGCGVFAGVAAIVRTWAASFILTEDSSYGVGALFCWGEVEEWVVLITMSIPPVWPLFRPFMQRFIQSNQQYSFTAASDQPSPAFTPPLVTTTISISSTKDAPTTRVGSQSNSRGSLEQNAHKPVAGKAAERQEAWVESSEVEERVSP